MALCGNVLNDKNLNKEVKRNHWYIRMIDNVPPELASSKYFSFLDEKSGYMIYTSLWIK